MKIQQRGITFLLAVIVSALTLSISLGISFILLGELKLAVYGKQSFIAFYTADSGIDCALYWDREQNGFADPLGVYFPYTPTVILCGNQTPSLVVDMNFNDGHGPTTTTFSLDLASNRCAKIMVQKMSNSTKIQSLGQNIACGALSGANTVQRGIEVTY